VISSIQSQPGDNRPYTTVFVFNKPYLALLDSGATTSCFGGSLAKELIENHKIDKVATSVRTADGQRQKVIGTIITDIRYNSNTKSLRFLVVPIFENEIICGWDFFELFGLHIVDSPIVSAIGSSIATMSLLELTPQQRLQLDAAISAFPSAEKEGLGLTSLVQHVIDTGDAKPIKQKFYPISPAREKWLYQEVDRMLSLGVIEEAEGSPWASPGVLIVTPGKNRCCLDSRKLIR